VLEVVDHFDDLSLHGRSFTNFEILSLKRSDDEPCGPRHCDGIYHFVITVWRAKEAESDRVRYWEIIADNLSKRGCTWGCASTVDARGRTIFVADAHCCEGKRFIVRADEKLTAFVELKSAIRAARLGAARDRWARLLASSCGLIAGYCCRTQASVLLKFAKG
jgi:hypothetical protein